VPDVTPVTVITFAVGTPAMVTVPIDAVTTALAHPAPVMCIPRWRYPEEIAETVSVVRARDPVKSAVWSLKAKALA
jgi:hypothetical protein